jgi:hypothetical protein
MDQTVHQPSHEFDNQRHENDRLPITDDKETLRTEWMSGVFDYTHAQIISSWTLESLDVPQIRVMHNDGFCARNCFCYSQLLKMA